ncbi:hypothetical protein CgunFtcFv8_017390 [Champsocephalus gunnari]|uniref:Uncharacterized protein n=1 Tax=Champsocephalus gunnari TaxID=52237 RepID=A0AAN8DM45_CHAGU|nr:hypothetical protein CgunFtcFv8_017390 [Champsocephalus gunnari]
MLFAYLQPGYLTFVLPPCALSSPVLEANLSPAADVLMSMVVGTFSRTPGAKWNPDRQQGEQRRGLSAKAGLSSITMPIETAAQTAAQSPALLGQIRPPDRAALQLDPTHYNGQTRESTSPKTPTAFPISRPRCFHTIPAETAKIPQEPTI